MSTNNLQVQSDTTSKPNATFDSFHNCHPLCIGARTHPRRYWSPVSMYALKFLFQQKYHIYSLVHENRFGFFFVRCSLCLFDFSLSRSPFVLSLILLLYGLLYLFCGILIVCFCHAYTINWLWCCWLICYTMRGYTVHSLKVHESGGLRFNILYKWLFLRCRRFFSFFFSFGSLMRIVCF